MRSRAEFAAALVQQVLGAGAVALLATREWQTVTTPRPKPFTEDVLGLSGRTVDGAPTAFALVALAGVVAVLATNGVVRRLIGGLIALAGVAIALRCASAIAAVSTSRARVLVAAKHPRVERSDTLAPQVTTHAVWGVLSVVGAVLVVVAGAMIAWRGGRWNAMSTRYEAPVAVDPADAEGMRARADAALWIALERGDDPTSIDPRDDH